MGLGSLTLGALQLHGVLDLGCLMLRNGPQCCRALHMLGLGEGWGAAVPPTAPLLRAQVCPSISSPCEAVPSQHLLAVTAAPPCSTSLPLSLLPPILSWPDPCPGAGGPDLTCSSFSPLSLFFFSSEVGGGELSHGCWCRGSEGCAASGLLLALFAMSSPGPRHDKTSAGPLCPAAWPLATEPAVPSSASALSSHSSERTGSGPAMEFGGVLPHG